MKLTIKIIILSFLILSCKNESNKISENIFTIPPQKMTHKIDSKFEFEFKSIEANSLNSKAIELAKNGNMKIAYNMLYKALELEPNNAVIISNIANVEAHNSNIQKSRDLYNQSIELSDSSYYPAIVGLSGLYLTTKEYEKAIDLSKFVIKNDKNNSDLYVNLVIAQTALGDCDSANDSFAKLKENGENSKFHENSHYEHLIDKCSPYLINCK